MILEACLDAPGIGGSDALVDAEGAPQVGGGLAGVAVCEARLSWSFKGACFLEGPTGVSGDGQCLAVVVAGRTGG